MVTAILVELSFLVVSVIVDLTMHYGVFSTVMGLFFLWGYVFFCVLLMISINYCFTMGQSTAPLLSRVGASQL